MQRRPLVIILLWACLTLQLPSLHFGWGPKCGANTSPTVKQTQVGKGNGGPKFKVEVENNCGMCPVIDVHLKCGTFTQDLVSPTVFKVLGHGDCVLNNGFPLQPLHNFSFNYSHSTMFPLSPSTWYFQCE